MTIDFLSIIKITIEILPFAITFFIFLHRMDKKISLVQNDITWLKQKAAERREHFSNSPYINE